MAQKKKLICPRCKVEMNHHASKDHPADEAAGARPKPVLEVHTCPKCGESATRHG
jgi:hypothetical protein